MAASRGGAPTIQAPKAERDGKPDEQEEMFGKN
jgi:hypothetical protein